MVEFSSAAYEKMSLYPLLPYEPEGGFIRSEQKDLLDDSDGNPDNITPKKIDAFLALVNSDNAKALEEALEYQAMWNVMAALYDYKSDLPGDPLKQKLRESICKCLEHHLHSGQSDSRQIEIACFFIQQVCSKEDQVRLLSGGPSQKSTLPARLALHPHNAPILIEILESLPLSQAGRCLEQNYVVSGLLQNGANGLKYNLQKLITTIPDTSCAHMLKRPFTVNALLTMGPEEGDGLSFVLEQLSRIPHNDAADILKSAELMAKMVGNCPQRRHEELIPQLEGLINRLEPHDKTKLNAVFNNLCPSKPDTPRPVSQERRCEA